MDRIWPGGPTWDEVEKIVKSAQAAPSAVDLIKGLNDPSNAAKALVGATLAVITRAEEGWVDRYHENWEREEMARYVERSQLEKTTRKP